MKSFTFLLSFLLTQSIWADVRSENDGQNQDETVQTESVPAEELVAKNLTPKTSEAYYQAPKDAWVVKPMVEYSNLVGDLKGSNKSISDSGYYYSISLERGWTDEIATELALVTQESTVDVVAFEHDKKGMGDLRFTTKGNYSLNENSRVYYGAHVKYSMGDKETKWNFTGNPNLPVVIDETTAQTGGASLTPYVAYETKLNNNPVGVGLTQTIWGKERTTNNSGSAVNIGAIPASTTERGGGLTELKAYYEHGFTNSFKLGTTARYKWVSGIEQDFGTGYEKYTSGQQIFALTAYPTYRVSEGVTVLGTVAYQTLVNKELTYSGMDLDGGSQVDVSVSGRFSF